jgi:hypothetical protein
MDAPLVEGGDPALGSHLSRCFQIEDWLARPRRALLKMLRLIVRVRCMRGAGDWADRSSATP